MPNSAVDHRGWMVGKPEVGPQTSGIAPEQSLKTGQYFIEVVRLT
jgi:hypothetical protein